MEILGTIYAKSLHYYPNRELIAEIYRNDDWRYRAIRLNRREANALADFVQGVGRTLGEAHRDFS